MPQKVVVVGAGPVGSTAALYAAVRGYDVEIYELRPDLRDPNTVPLNFAKSINLALSERGINALRKTGLPNLADSVLGETFPMDGRMLHVGRNGKDVQKAQAYDARGKTLLAMDRTGLNTTLLNYLETMPNVTFYFSRKLVGVDFEKNLAWFEKIRSHSHKTHSVKSSHSSKSSRSKSHSSSSKSHSSSSSSSSSEIEVAFDFMIGADGAHSAVRYHLMKFVPMAYQQEYIDKLWCQFHIPPNPSGEFRLPPNYLHIWPQDDAMFIALPNLDKTFTATLFLSREGFDALDESGKVVEYFNNKFPGVVPNLISEDALRHQYTANQHLPLISIKCSPYHFRDAGVIVGDAAHAMVPFYGQGMNAGLEDVRVLFDCLDAHPDDRAEALKMYSEQRTPDAQTINDLALRNYQEMASDVKKPLYRFRKWFEETLDVYLPFLGWATQYSRVTFSNMRYSEVQRRAARQASILNGLVGFTLAACVGTALWFRASAAVRANAIARVNEVAKAGAGAVARVGTKERAKTGVMQSVWKMFQG